MNSLRAATLWRKAQGQKRAPTNSSANLRMGKKGRPKDPPKVSNTGDGLQDSLNNAKSIAILAYGNVLNAGTMEQASMLSIHNKAIDQVFKAEKAYREEMERRGILVSKQEITELCRRTMDAILKPLKKLAIETGPQCVNKDALMIVKILQRKVDEIIATGRKAMAEM